ncbi:MAG TPA: hypothetical protein VNI20_13400 [Fimbriimonadaceae bacterium]|nr:hypothetical protein [Fimbriimonadaceae bacterium]
MPTKIVGDRWYVSYAELGSPKRKGDYKVPGVGTVVLDDADIHYAETMPQPGFYVRRSVALGPDAFVVVSRKQTA